MSICGYPRFLLCSQNVNFSRQFDCFEAISASWPINEFKIRGTSFRYACMARTPRFAEVGTDGFL